MFEWIKRKFVKQAPPVVAPTHVNQMNDLRAMARSAPPTGGLPGGSLHKALGVENMHVLVFDEKGRVAVLTEVYFESAKFTFLYPARKSVEFIMDKYQTSNFDYVLPEVEQDG